MGALILILSREISYVTSADGLVMFILLILATLGIWGLAIYLIIKPGFKMLQSLLFKGSVTMIVTAGIIAGFIHYIRFIPSPEAASALSKVIATLLAIAGMSAWLQLIWVVWASCVQDGKE
jgi:hypothetical protein